MNMTRRLTLVMAGVGLAALLASVLVATSLLQRSYELQKTEQLQGLAGAYARDLYARLGAAEVVVQSLLRNEGALEENTLRQNALRTDQLSGLTLVAWQRSSEAEARAAVPLSDADRAVLGSGQSLLRTGAQRGGRQSVYIVRRLMVRGQAAVGYFEIASSWLWQGMDKLPVSGGGIAVVDGAGNLLQASDEVGADLRYLFSRERDYGRDRATADPDARTWQADGANWRGAALRVRTDVAHLDSPGLTVLAYTPASTLAPVLRQVTAILPLPLFILALAVLAGVLYLRMRWVPVLGDLRHSLTAMTMNHYERVPVGSASDAPAEAAREYNRAVAVIEERVQALTVLEEVDRLLLETAEFESSLDAVLARVCRLTHCHCASVVLLDPDAPSHGRCYLTLAGSDACAVSRIGISEEWLEYLRENPEGTTIARWEPDRHGSLEPMCDAGAECFWVWPIINQMRVAAILAVGYPGTPVLAPDAAYKGRECARRLAVALGNNERGAHLYRQAHYDALTSLPNRVLFRDRLGEELASAVARGQRGALLYVDLDHFKKVNDTVGHSAGDQLLTVVAQRLRSCIKEGDTVARLGGDEFTVILRDVADGAAAAQVAARITTALQLPVHVAGRDHYVRASIGVTLFPDDGKGIEELMRNADLAMYQAKDGGRARAEFYSPQMRRLQTPVAHSGLYRALKRREFSLYYQPQYSLADGRLVGLEALLRWQTPRDGMRYPAEFVPAAEESGVIVDIGSWVLEAACNQLAVWREQNIAPERLAINVSAQQLRQPEFPSLVRRALDRLGIPPEMLEIELTESTLADSDVRSALKALAGLGVRLALDDFGTGYSALNYLRLSQVQTVKIDRSFLQEIPANPTAATLAESIITMAHALKKRVVAEGVETIEQLEFLRERGCDVVQGFYLAQPRPSVEVSELLAIGKAEAFPERLRASGAG
ncbi:MAG TPA: EAL domain-containing protein [Steroidobacteraceae bacterium]|nr:EAL domain-containing protein [Steroidobacteraceae bacterium]